MKNKPTKRNVERSTANIMHEDAYRLVSRPGEMPFQNYLRLENADLPAADAARKIKEHFDL